MRYSDTPQLEPLYVQSSSLHHMLLFTVILAFFIGMALLWLGRHGRVLWLQVWSIGLMLASLAYVFAYLAGWVRTAA
jgi:hypothetical protein